MEKVENNKHNTCSNGDYGNCSEVRMPRSAMKRPQGEIGSCPESQEVSASFKLKSQSAQKGRKSDMKAGTCPHWHLGEKGQECKGWEINDQQDNRTSKELWGQEGLMEDLVSQSVHFTFSLQEW